MFGLFRKKPAPQPEVKVEYLMGTPEPVRLFQAYTARCGCSDNHHGYYTTAQLAHENHPNASVRPVKFYKIGDHYIEDLRCRLLDLQVDGARYQALPA